MSSPPTRLMNRNFFLLWQGQLVSQVGAQAFLIAQMAWVKEATQSTSIVGLMTMLSLLPAVILSPLGGVIADRYSRRWIIVLCDAITGLAVLVLVVVFALRPSVQVILAALLAIGVLKGIMGAFFSPAIAAAIPDLVPEDRVAAANSMQQAVNQVSSFVGQAAGGVLYAVMGPRLMFLVDGLTYLFSALSECFIIIPQHLRERSKGGSLRDWLREIRQETLEGLHYVWTNGWVRTLVLMAAVFNFFIAPITALLLFYVQDFLQKDVKWYGFMLAALSLGALIGYSLAGHPALAKRLTGGVLIVQLVAAAFFLGVLGVTRDASVAVTMMLLGGVMFGSFNISVVTALQLSTPSEFRGRVFGLLLTIAGSLSPLAIGLSGVIADLIDQNIPALYIGCATLAGLSAIITLLTGEFEPPNRAELEAGSADLGRFPPPNLPPS